LSVLPVMDMKAPEVRTGGDPSALPTHPANDLNSVDDTGP
jgi:hypothetical protein